MQKITDIMSFAERTARVKERLASAIEKSSTLEMQHNVSILRLEANQMRNIEKEFNQGEK